MLFKLTFTAFLATTFTTIDGAPPGNAFGMNDGKGNRPEVGPNDRIAKFVKNEHALGNKKAKFKIKAQRGDGVGGGKPFEVDVVEASFAVTPETLFKDIDGHVQPVGDTGHTLLLADLFGADASDIAILSVNMKTEEVQGVVWKKGQKSMKFNQGKGKSSTVQEEEDWTPPKWSCGAREKAKVKSDSSKNGLFDRRALLDHTHDHEDHDHHHSREDHDRSIHELDDMTIDSIRNSLRGSNIQVGKRRRLQSGAYNFQVDLYIEIDTALVNSQGGQQGAINYVNTIFSAANQIYEHEIDTHLHVANIVYTTMYDNFSSKSDALDQMHNTYRSLNGWHTAGIDLHHGLFGKSMNGGEAFRGVICDSYYGFGVSGDLSGDFTNIGAPVVFDLVIVTHEIGHQFNSKHTHEYSPQVDNCSPVCPSNIPAGSATLMSYCDLCDGGMSNVKYTFGGEYDGTGDKSSISNWINNAELISNGNSNFSSNDPRRVSKVMYDHVSSRGSCVAVTNTPAPTPSPTSKPTLRPTSKPTPSPTPNPTMNGAPTKLPTKAPTQQPVLAPTQAVYDSVMGAPRCAGVVLSCDMASLLVGISNSEPNHPNTIDACVDGDSGTYGNDESIDRILVKSADGNPMQVGSSAIIEATVHPWDNGSYDYADFYYSADANNLNWQLIARQKPSTGGFQTLSQGFSLVGGSSTQAVRVVFKYSENTGNTAVPCPGGAYDDVDDIIFGVSTVGAPTMAPTPLPTPSPTNILTAMPTKNPTAVPTKNPSAIPANNPTAVPTKKPTSVPTKKPTSVPTKKPTNGGGPQTAIYDSNLGVPKCGSIGNSCDSGPFLLLGVATNGPEPNQPNSLDNCIDGLDGTFHSDESIDRIIVKTVDGTNLAPGKVARIEATVWAYDNGSADRADFYYAIDASNPNWVFISTSTPSGGGTRIMTAQYTIPSGGTAQAVRVNFRYSNNGGTGCSGGNYDDVDDLVFVVA